MSRSLYILLLVALILLFTACSSNSPAPSFSLGGDGIDAKPSETASPQTEVSESAPVIPLPDTIYTLDENASLVTSITDFRPFKDYIVFERCEGDFPDSGFKLIGKADGTLPATDYRRSAWIYGLEAIFGEIAAEYSNIQLEVIIDREQTSATHMKLYYTTDSNEWFDSSAAVDKTCTVNLYDEESYFFAPFPITQYTKLMFWPIVGEKTIFIKQINIYAISD